MIEKLNSLLPKEVEASPQIQQIQLPKLKKIGNPKMEQIQLPKLKKIKI